MKTKVLFLISRFLDGGIESVMLAYLRQLAKNPDIELTLGIGIYSGELEVFHARLPESCRVVYLVKNKKLTDIKRRRVIGKVPTIHRIYDEVLLSPIRRMLQRKNFKRLTADKDVVIDFDSCFYSFIHLAPGCKIVYSHFSYNKIAQQNPRRLKRIGSHLKAYDYVMNISQKMNEEAILMFPECADKMRVIYNGKDVEELRQKAQEQVADPRIKRPYILAVERLEESQKDLSTLLQAYRILRDTYAHTEKLYIIGRGKSESMLKQLCVDLEITDNVEFLGFIPNPYPWMHHSRALVHSAKFEGLPTVLIESLLLRKWIVSTDCPTGPSEILNNGEAGLLVPVGDAPSMAQAIHDILTDHALQERLRAGEEKQIPRFTIDKACEGLQKHFMYPR